MNDSTIEITNHLKILGVHIDNGLTFKEHVSAVLKKVYARIGALRRLKKLVPRDVALLLYKAYILPYLEYGGPLLIGINNTLAKKLESANYYALKTLLNAGNSLGYNTVLSQANMESLQNRRYFQSLTLLFNCIKNNGPSYISNLFEHRPLRYNLRNGGCNLVQPSYNNRFYHNSFTYKLSHLWNELPVLTKQSANVNIFRKRLATFNFDNFKTSCKCDHCLS